MVNVISWIFCHLSFISMGQALLNPPVTVSQQPTPPDKRNPRHVTGVFAQYPSIIYTLLKANASLFLSLYCSFGHDFRIWWLRCMFSEDFQYILEVVGAVEGQ